MLVLKNRLLGTHHTQCVCGSIYKMRSHICPGLALHPFV